jgi:hypothetical protein
MTEQQRFVKKPVEISATQWFRNGDHPLDHHPMDTKNPTDEDRKRYDDYLATEGKVVRYYRHPEVSGKATCQKCGNVMHRHGWIDTLEGGHIVCPGDWIITGVQGEHYPCKPDIFEATYQPAGDQHPDDAAVDQFAAAMKAKLAKKRAEGRGGWQTASEADLSALLHEHVAKGDPLDVGNLAMMLHQNGQRVAALSHAEGEAVPVGYLSVLSDGTRIVDARQQYDAPEVWPLYTHPAPQVAGLTETAIKSSPAYRALHREKDHLLGLLKDQAPQVAVPEALTKYDGYVPPEDGSAGEYYVDGWNSCRDAILANSAPAQTVSASVPEQKTWNQAGGREDLRYTEGWNDCRAAMLAAAPAAPAGELVTRCTAGLGCDEKGYCDAAATGQGDLCDRRTMAHEQLVSDPDGLPGAPRPMSTAPRDGTMVRLLVQFTNHGVNDGFDSGPAWTIGANTYDDSGDDEWHIAGWDWQQDCFTAGEGEPLGWLPMLSAPAPDEREIGARRGRLS